MPHNPVTLAAPAPRAERLGHAMDEGLVLPDGAVTVLRPHAGESFAPLTVDRLHLVQGFRPDHDALAAAGHDVGVHAQPAPTVLVCLPRAKGHALMLIAQAAGLARQMVLVDGQKTDGIDSILKALRTRVAVTNISKAHGKLIWFDPRGADFSDWAGAAQSVSTEFGPMVTTPGLFSADGVDPASAMLARALPPELPARMADFGAGWGYLSAAILSRKGPEVLHLVESEHDALDAARQNIPDPRAQFHWADATGFALPDALGGIVMNPPFHVGRDARPELGLAFIANAARALGTRGQLWLVANRHLPYEQALEDRFVHLTVLEEDNRFRVWHAKQPRRVKR
ncbi:MAG: 16S rRNA (guanine1207-N2)-methyltransferase RsmC [Roseibaca calidilacus]|uniref:16S rRNA (Guanine1207-N2)-methyltransferase n=1 Tax=Roseibaca calidilacus TaxID=1666912 RepID=A0A0P7VUM5_9RHOB|nr:methyltransferase [Roseibaca calidilacus]KPP90804.1 MAG: 16S rRNA (guanine1207-N2)-methyltransferase RsmC [Roseibaca calidilacus]CUX83591.1 16S rRNA (guanine1207-N2)-methyltransferase [Roseibaca calidilacus]